MNRATKGVTVHAPALARATRIDASNGCCTRSEDPALLTELAQKPSSAPAPLAESLRDLNASLLLFPCPATPDTMRHTHRVNACRRLVRRVVLTASVVSSIRLRKPGRSTSSCLQQAPLSLFPAAANPALRAGNAAVGGQTCHSLHAAIRRLLPARAREILPAGTPQEIVTFGLPGFWSRQPQHTSRGWSGTKSPVQCARKRQQGNETGQPTI